MNSIKVEYTLNTEIGVQVFTKDSEAEKFLQGLYNRKLEMANVKFSDIYKRCTKKSGKEYGGYDIKPGFDDGCRGNKRLREINKPKRDLLRSIPLKVTVSKIIK
jgi:hypothetical protein